MCQLHPWSFQTGLSIYWIYILKRLCGFCQIEAQHSASIQCKAFSSGACIKQNKTWTNRNSNLKLTQTWTIQLCICATNKTDRTDSMWWITYWHTCINVLVLYFKGCLKRMFLVSYRFSWSLLFHCCKWLNVPNPLFVSTLVRKKSVTLDL